MNEFLNGSYYFGIVLSLAAYWAGVKINKRLRYTLLNPLLVAVALVLAVLVIFRIDYNTYNYGADILTKMLTPVTVCLAVPMYKQIQVLMDNKGAILAGIISGCLACAVSVLAMGLLFRMDRQLICSMLPKSITTAIAIGVSEEIGGIPNITIMAVVVTGLFGAITAKTICRIFRIREPVAVGLACGNSAHAIGTSKALEFGEVEGAMSSLSIVIAGVMTVLTAPLAASFLN